MNTATAPTTTVNATARKAATEYPVSETPEDKTIVRVTTHHSKGTKTLVSVASRVTVKNTATPGIVVHTYIPTDSVLIARIPVVRYSARMLASAHEDALERLNENRADVEGIAALFAV